CIITSLVSVLLNQGHGTFGGPVLYHVGNWSQSLIAADLNGDRYPDLAVISHQPGEEGVVSLLLNQGDGHFKGATVSHVFGGYLTSLIALDLDGDGRDDFATTDSSQTVSVLLNRGDGELKRAVSYPVE